MIPPVRAHSLTALFMGTVMAKDRVPALLAIRDKLTAEFAEAHGRDSAVIAKELRAVIAEIDRVAPVEGLSRIDELAARRSGGVANPEGGAGTAGVKPATRRRRGGAGGAVGATSG